MIKLLGEAVSKTVELVFIGTFGVIIPIAIFKTVWMEMDEYK